MQRGLIALVALGLAACGQAQGEPNIYPQSAQAQFEASCPSENAVCTCTWDKLTRTLTYEEYEAALTRFRETGLMEPRVTRARTACVERHRE
jgi:hypothetical protein